jgi:hypothetical protein
MLGMEITETLVVIAAGRAEYAAPNANISRYHQLNCLGDRSKLALAAAVNVVLDPSRSK